MRPIFLQKGEAILLEKKKGEAMVLDQCEAAPMHCLKRIPLLPAFRFTSSTVRIDSPGLIQNCHIIVVEMYVPLNSGHAISTEVIADWYSRVQCTVVHTEKKFSIVRWLAVSRVPIEICRSYMSNLL
jgi:hypothetical protein